MGISQKNLSPKTSGMQLGGAHYTAKYLPSLSLLYSTCFPSTFWSWRSPPHARFYVGTRTYMHAHR